MESDAEEMALVPPGPVKYAGADFLEPNGDYLYFDPVSKRFITMEGNQVKVPFAMWNSVERNPHGYLSIEKCIHSDFMGALSKRMRAVSKNKRNGRKRAGQGPSLHFVSVGRTSALGPHLSYCVHICDAINALTTVPLHCGVPTEDTKLEIVDDKFIRHVRGKETVHFRRRKRDREGQGDSLIQLWNLGDVSEGTLKKDMTKLNFCEVYVRMFPVVDKTDVNNRAVIRVVSMAAAPGFDLIQLIKLVTDESVNATGRFKFKTANAERASMWQQMVAEEIEIMNVATDQQSGELLNQRTLLYDEYTHRGLHPYHLLSSLSIIKRATALLMREGFISDDRIDHLSIPGLAMVLCDDPVEKARRVALYLGACEIESENIETWVDSHQKCCEYRETMLKSSKKNKKDKNAVEDEIETLPVEDVWNIVFYLPFLKKPNIAPPFDDEEVDAMIEEMEDEEVSAIFASLQTMHSAFAIHSLTGLH